MPFNFTEKDWKDSPTTTTPLSAAAIEDLETRLSDYTDDMVGKDAGVFNVKHPDFGAVGNGIADDTSAAQAAIDAAELVAGFVYFPPGTYKVSARLVIGANNVTLAGSGPGSLIQSTGFAAGGVIHSDGFDSLTVRDLAIDGAGANLSGKGLVYLHNSDFSKIVNCQLRDTNGTSAGVVLESCNSCLVMNNDLSYSDLGYGIVVGTPTSETGVATDNNVIAYNMVVGTDLDSIFLTSSLSSTTSTTRIKNNKIIGNHVSGCGDAGIECGIGTTGTLVEGNTVSGSVGPNILFRDAFDSRAVGNRALDNTGNSTGYGGGILVADQATGPTIGSQRISIIGNTCTGNAGAGIRVAPDSVVPGQNFVVQGNICRSNGATAVGGVNYGGIIVQAAPGTSVTGNTCISNTGAGIRTGDTGGGAGKLLVSNNVCANNSTYGINIQTNHTIINGNRCYDNASSTQTHGLRLESTQCNNATVMGNNFQGNATGAISNDGLGANHFRLNNQGFTSASASDNGSFDLELTGNVDIMNGKLQMLASDGSGFLSQVEQSSAPTGSSNTAKIYAIDNGAGKTKLMVIFGSGAAQQIAIEP